MDNYIYICNVIKTKRVMSTVSKKTIKVKNLLNHANGILASKDPYFTKDFKAGVCAMLDKSLHLSNNYNGFMFINNEDSDIDTLGYYTRKYF